MTAANQIPWESTLPNHLTLFRIRAAAPVVILYDLGFTKTAVALYIVCCITDFLDGRLAKWMKCSTAWGHLADPIADKLCCAAAMLVVFSAFGSNLNLMGPLVIILLYDGLVIAMRNRVGYMRTNECAQWKTAMLMIGLVACMILVAGKDYMADVPEVNFAAAYELVELVAIWVLWIASMLAILSAIIYLRENFRSLFGKTETAE